MGKTYKESHFPGSKQSREASSYQSKKKIRHSKMEAYSRQKTKQFQYETNLQRKTKSNKRQSS